MSRRPTTTSVTPKDARTEYGLSAEQIVRAWQLSGSAQEAADKLGMPKPILHARVSGYRKKGVRLKSMPRTPGREIDVDAMNRLIQTLGTGKGGRK